jgi:hypothetical protein
MLPHRKRDVLLRKEQAAQRDVGCCRLVVRVDIKTNQLAREPGSPTAYTDRNNVDIIDIKRVELHPAARSLPEEPRPIPRCNIGQIVGLNTQDCDAGGKTNGSSVHINTCWEVKTPP